MFKIIIYVIIASILTACQIGNNSSSTSNIIVNNTGASIIHDSINCSLPNIVSAQTSTKMLVVLLNYNNAMIDSNNSVWRDKIFSKELNQLNHYYLEASANSFEFSQATENIGCSNDGIVSVKLDKNHPNINVDNTSFTANLYPDLNTALTATDSYIDFSNYDTNADGYISRDELLFTFIIAGYEDAYEGIHVEKGVWGHQSCMDSEFDELVLDSVVVANCEYDGNFALFGEKHDKSNPHDATIGIIAHELGHSAFDLPDLYNTTGNSGGIGYFGLMGAGTWAQKDDFEHPGNTPTHFCAWSKYKNQWVNPITTTGSTTLAETSSSDYNLIKVPINSSSYYLLENRNNSGYDRGLYSLSGNFQGGMAIWKVDETKLSSYYMDANTVNADTNNKAVDLVEAVNGSIDSSGHGGAQNALYYSGNVNSFTTLVTDISVRGSVMGLNIN